MDTIMVDEKAPATLSLAKVVRKQKINPAMLKRIMNRL
jgi:hypothetical protein